MGEELDSGNASVFDYLWSTFDAQYALFGIKDIDWKAMRSIYRAQAINAENDEILFNVLSSMIGPLDDGHVSLYRPDINLLFSTYEPPGIFADGYHYSIESVRPYLRDIRSLGSGIITVGILRDANFGYLSISSFTDGGADLTALEAWVHDADTAIDSLMSMNAILVDVRGNNGGYRANARHIASRFIHEKKFYMKSRMRVGPRHDDFGSVMNHSIEPRGNTYTKTVYLITDINTVSAGEWFVLMLKDEPHVSHIGWRTTGALGTVVARELPNSWVFTTTVGLTTDEKGNSYEEVGIVPETVDQIQYTANTDAVMEWILNIPRE